MLIFYCQYNVNNTKEMAIDGGCKLLKKTKEMPYTPVGDGGGRGEMSEYQKSYSTWVTYGGIGGREDRR